MFPYADYDEGDDEDYNDVGIYFDSTDDDDDSKLLFIPVDTYYDQPVSPASMEQRAKKCKIKIKNLS